MEKLLKTIESLKVPAFSLGTESNVPVSITSAVVAASDAVKTKKKERIAHCVTVTDAILNPSVQNLMDFPKILESVTEVLFQLCNDPDSDIRLVAVDCLNRIVRTLRGILLNKFQLEVYREIRKNQAPRSLRAALSVFATLSSDIRPNRCRGFIQSLLPTLVQISKRTEELLYENLSTSFLHILQNLGLFLTDSDVKLLCQEYLKNLESKSTVVRRSSAAILVYVCQYSRKPNIFLPRLLDEVIQLLTPNLMEKTVSTLIGVLLCVRQCITPLYAELDKSFPGIADKDQVVKKIIQVYEICLILCNHDDHNIITTSLETLQQLLTAPVFEVARILTSSEGIQNSFDSELWLRKNRAETPPLRPQSYWPSVSTEFAELDDPSPGLLLLDNEFDLQTFRSDLSSTTSDAREEVEINISSSIGSRRDSEVFIMASTSEAESGSPSSLGPNSEEEDERDNCSRLKAALELECFPELHIGSLYDTNVPLHYCARFLAYNFLLAGKEGHERSDKEIRVTVKALAVNCIINSIQLCPVVYFLVLSLSELNEQEVAEKPQKVSDVSLYSKHHDPLLRGSTYLLISHFLSRILQTNHGVWEYEEIEMENLVSILNNGLRDQSNIGVKYALSGLSECLVPILRCKNGTSLLGEIFQNLFAIASNPYWLVKVNLTELLAAIEWDSVPNHDQIQDRTLNLFLILLSDEDVRVRSSSVSGLIKFVQCCGYREDWILGRLNPFSTKAVINSIKCDIFSLPQKEHLHSNVSKYLEKVLDRIIPELSKLHEKHSIASYYFALSSLADSFPPTVYQSAWRCCREANELPLLFSVAVELLKSASIVTDIYIHQNLLSLASNLFLGLIHRSTGSDLPFENDENSPFIGSHKMLTFYGLYLLNHCFGVVKLYNNILKPHMESTVQKKSPLSPAKKFLTKDVEKKSSSANPAEPEKKSKPLQRQQSNTLLGPNICPVQLKRIEDSLSQSWKIYKSNLDPVVTHKFTLVLISCLEVLGSLFSWMRNDFVGLTIIIEEVLTTAPTIFKLAPVPTLKCMKQILRCLNPSSSPPALFDNKNSSGSSEDSLPEFENFCENFYKNFPASRRSGLVSNEKSSLGTYIRSFEPIVITALKTYLSSSDSFIQAEILLFVSELIKGHVNYAMVDSNQVFLTAVIKQLTFLEEGQFRDSAVVVDAIFEYFTHLSHMERPSKKFIDTPKLLQLCDGLVASGQNPATNYIPAMKKIVYDLFIRQGSIGITNLEKKEIEAQREVLFQNSLKLLNVPDVLPMLFLLIHGRRGISEAKWSTESGIVARALLESIETDRLIIANSTDFSSLISILFSVHATTLPSLSTLTASLKTTLQIEVNDPVSLIHWMATVNTFWLVILRTVHCNEDFIPIRLLLDILIKFVEQIQPIFTWPKGNGILESKSYSEQLVIFIKVTCFLLCKDTSGEAVTELRSEAKMNEFQDLAQQLAKLSLFHPELRKVFCEFLTVLAYPYTEVWNTILSSLHHPAAKELFMSEFVPSLVKHLLPTTDPELEKWLIQNYSICIIEQSHSPQVASLWTRLSETSRDFLMQRLVDIIDQPNVEVLRLKAVLNCIERGYEKYQRICVMLCIKLLKLNTLSSILFETSQFACFLFVHIQGQENLFLEDDAKILKDFTENAGNNLRFPRLVSLITKFLTPSLLDQNEDRSVITSIVSDVKEFKDDPIAAWCCDEINPSEGAALAQILSNLNYTQVFKILSLPDFNLSILKYVFRHLRLQVLEGQVPLDELVTLLTTEIRSSLMNKLPLGVAALDFIIEMLDKWETLIPENQLMPLNTANDILEVPFRNKICDVWILLTELLKLKASVLAEDASWREKSLHNNYITTTVFTFSFQYMKVLCHNEHLPIHQLTVFLQFACSAIQDYSFLQFFNVRDHPSLIFTCIHALGAILKSIITHFRIPYVSTESEDTWCELNEDCVQILKSFNFMLDVIWKVKSGRLEMEPILFEPLKTLIAGLAKCELVNGWLLISHLGWKPPLTNKAQIFPPILHIPLEILQNEKDLLIKYIYKLNFFGIASKIQFEENWMTFLSVINSFGDENYNIQIIIVGLQALSMMLEQSVKVVYTPDPSSRKLVKNLERVEYALNEMEPEICRKYLPALPHWSCTKTFENEFNVDITSCIRFLIDLFSQWMQNIQGKMPLLLISKVVESIVNIAKYFDEISQFTWMFDTLMEINKGCEKEDDILWSHLVHGIFVAASNITPEPEIVTSLGQTLEAALASPSANVANAAIQTALEYFQNQPEALPLLNIVIPYLLNCTQLSETLNDTESHSYSAWKLLLFIWIHCSSSGAGGSTFEQDILGNVLTVLSPLNKVHVSIRLLVLRSLRTRVEIGGLKPETKKIVTKVALDTLKTPNLAIFYESIKLFLTLFYCDFAEFYGAQDPDPEVLIQMVERSEVLFLMLKNGKKFATKIASRVLPILVLDFLPPSEILNRAISQFLSPTLTSPELLAPTIAQIFEKARRKPQEAILVREWITASLPNFIASADISRSMWNLTVFFVGVSKSPDVSSLLPFAQLRRNPSQIRKLFIHSAVDYYSSLKSAEKETFELIIRKGPFPSSSNNPYSFLLDLIYSLQ